MRLFSEEEEAELFQLLHRLVFRGVDVLGILRSLDDPKAKRRKPGPAYPRIKAADDEGRVRNYGEYLADLKRLHRRAPRGARTPDEIVGKPHVFPPSRVTLALVAYRAQPARSRGGLRLSLRAYAASVAFGEPDPERALLLLEEARKRLARKRRTR